MFPVFIPVWINSVFSDSSVIQCDTKWMSCCDTLHLSQKYWLCVHYSFYIFICYDLLCTESPGFVCVSIQSPEKQTASKLKQILRYMLFYILLCHRIKSFVFLFSICTQVMCGKGPPSISWLLLMICHQQVKPGGGVSCLLAFVCLMIQRDLLHIFSYIEPFSHKCVNQKIGELFVILSHFCWVLDSSAQANGTG